MEFFWKNCFLVSTVLLGLGLASCNKTGSSAPTFLGNPANGTPGTVSSANAGPESFKNMQSVQKLIYHVGPTDLTAKQKAGEMLEKPATLKFQVTEPVWVVGFEPKVIDSTGNILPGRLLYKAIIYNKAESNPLCASGNSGNPFAVATSTLTKVELPEGFGYPLLPEDPLEVKAVFHNPTEEEYPGVIFAFELTVIPMDQAKGYGDLKAILLDTDPCEQKPIAIEPGAFVEKSKTVTIPDGGSLMVANGVLSDYGIAVSLTHQEGSNASVVPFWRAEAQLNETHQIIDLTDNPFFDPVGKNIRSGDKLTLGVSFDNFSEEWHNEATGAAMIYLAPQE